MGRKKQPKRKEVAYCSRCMITHERPVGSRCHRPIPTIEPHVFDPVSFSDDNGPFPVAQPADTSSIKGIPNESATTNFKDTPNESAMSYKSIIDKQQAMVEALVGSMKNLQKDVQQLKQKETHVSANVPSTIHQIHRATHPTHQANIPNTVFHESPKNFHMSQATPLSYPTW